jgi:hypothetical protein
VPRVRRVSGGPALFLFRLFVAFRPSPVCVLHDGCVFRQAPSRALRPLAHGLPARGRRAHGALQLAVRQEVRWRFPAAHRGHRPPAQHRRKHPRHLRRHGVARPHVGRRGRVSGGQRGPALCRRAPPARRGGGIPRFHAGQRARATAR